MGVFHSYMGFEIHLALNFLLEIRCNFGGSLFRDFLSATCGIKMVLFQKI